MKVRIFTNLKNGVYHARIHTEDWSENERELMKKYREPEINLGGYFNYSDVTNWDEWNNNNPVGDGFKLDDNYARVMTESPFTQKFDTRNFLEYVDGSYESAQEWAQNMAYAWTRIIRDRIFQAVVDLNNNGAFNSREEIFDLSSYNGGNNGNG